MIGVWRYTFSPMDEKTKNSVILAAVFVFIIIASNVNKGIAGRQPVPAPAPPAQPIQAQHVPETFTVARVIDGDTFKLSNGQVVRYIGIDAPETVDPVKPVQCFGPQASDEDKKLVEGKEVTLVKDISETDKYGRILRYVYVGNLFVNDYLVRNGFARVETIAPDVAFEHQFEAAQLEAQKNSRGLWAVCATK